MIQVKESKNHYINATALSFGENDLENPNRVAVSLVGGAAILVHVKGTIDYAADGNFQRWTLKGYSTKLATNNTYYIYARLDRSAPEALITFSANRYALDGSIEGDSSTAPSTRYWYVRIGQLTETDGVTNRELTYDSGLLGTTAVTNAANDILSKAFVFHFDDKNNPDKLTSIEALAGLWTEYFLSAKGANPNGGGSSEGGSGTLGGLRNVAADADRTYDVAKMLVLEANSNLWVLKNLSDLVGLDEDALYRYLTNNEYAKKSDIPTIPTRVSAFVNDANYATTSDLDSRIDALVNGAPQAYDTLKEIADMLSKNVDSIDDILTALGTKANKVDVDAAISAVNASISALNTELSDKIDLKLDAATFNELFEKVRLGDGTYAIRAKLGLFTDYFLSSKGANPNGGSSTGGAGALYQLNDVLADGQQVSGAAKGALLMYNGTKWQGVSQSEIVPNLTGYAKESWVKAQGYLTGITSALVTGALGYTPYNAANFTKANIKSTLGISDWALAATKPSYAFSEITGKPTTLSGYGITDAYTKSQVDTKLSGYLPLSGGTIRGSLDVINTNTAEGLIKVRTNSSTIYPTIRFDGNTSWGYFGFSAANTPTYYDNSLNPYTLIHSGNIGSQSVASATKLQTARTIWGQSFNGTGNVNGRLSYNTTTLTRLGIGHDADSLIYGDTNDQTYIRGTNIKFQNVAGTNALTIANSNVGIGTNSPQYKLDVNGTTRTTKLVIGDGSIEWDSENKGFKIVGGLYTETYLSAKGANPNGGSSSGGGLITSLYRYADLGKTFADTSNDTFNAYTINKINTDLGNRISVLEGKATNVSFTQSLTSGTQIGTITIDGASKTIYAPTIPTSLKNPTALTFGSKTYDGSVARTILASDLGALTSHQTIYALTIKNSAGTTQLTYTPNSAAGSLTLTKAMVGLGNVENTALSTWKGTSNITTLGTITSGVWNGTKIANSYLANSAMTIAGTSVSLGGSITAATLQSNLGLGSFAYKSSLAFADLTGKPTTLSGYGITDAYTKSQVDSALGGYLPLSGGILTSNGVALTIKRYTANPVIGFNGGAEDVNERYGFLGFSGKDNPAYIDATGRVAYPLIHSGNIGSQSVASATKLQTARTIWGQSFDGTKDISGSLYLNNERAVYVYDSNSTALDAFRLSSGNAFTIGYGTSGAGYSTLLSGYNITLRYGTSRNNGLMLNSSGNVLIGTTTDSGYKLDVNGTLNASGAATLRGTLNVGGASLFENSLTVNGTSEFKSTLALANAKYIVSKYSDGITNHNILGLNANNALLINYGAVDRNVKAWHYGNEFRFNLYTDGAFVGALAWIDSKLGVGTSAPEYTADIRGTLGVSRSITLKGTTTDDALLKFSRSGNNYVVFPSTGFLTFATANGTSYITAAIDGDAIYPYTSGKKSIGKTGNRWGAIYGVDGDFSGTLHATTGVWSDGYVSAKGQNTSSDMRLKRVLEEVTLSVDEIAAAPAFRFAWKNGGGVDVGSSAQYWQGLLPDAVKERDGMLEMQYANIALLSAIALAKNFETHEERIERLEKENYELKKEIETLKIGGRYA